MMKINARTLGSAGVLMLLLFAALAVAGPTTTMSLGSSPQIPAAQGTAHLRLTENGNVEIKLSVKHLAPPGRITAGANVFVVWVRGLEAGAAAQNLGALKVDKNLNGKIRATTGLPSFDLFLTCEPSQTVTVPAAPELLPLQYMSK